MRGGRGATVCVCVQGPVGKEGCRERSGSDGWGLECHPEQFRLHKTVAHWRDLQRGSGGGFSEDITTSNHSAH